MLRVLVILTVISRANFVMQTFQHQMYVSRNSGSNSIPIQNGFVYSRVGNGPALMTTFGNSDVKPTETYAAAKTDEDITLKNFLSVPNEIECEMLESTGNDITGGVDISSKQNEERIKAKTKTKCLKEADSKEERLESTGHHVGAQNNMKEIFGTYDKEYRIDGEDVKTGSKSTYIGWPYTYQINDVNTINKAKDKRFLGADTSVIPVHEYPDYNPNNSPQRRLTNAYYEVTTDNPIYGNQPFFSFVLNDYFDKSNEEDPLIFKDFTWGKEFDHVLPYQNNDDNGRPSRHLDYKYPNLRKDYEKHFDLHSKTNAGDQETVTRKDFDSNREYAKYIKDDDKKANKFSEHDIKAHRQSGFKDFLDSFANKFGSEKENKNSKFMLKQNQDKGEKRKGFRRVYHKDEYQEDNEFYDNTNKKAQSEENGGSNINIGGSQAVLQTHAAASVGNEANLLMKRGETEDNGFEKNNMGHERNRLRDEKFNHYKSMANNAALSNNADYID